MICHFRFERLQKQPQSALRGQFSPSLPLNSGKGNTSTSTCTRACGVVSSPTTSTVSHQQTGINQNTPPIEHVQYKSPLDLLIMTKKKKYLKKREELLKLQREVESTMSKYEKRGDVDYNKPSCSYCHWR